MNSVQLETYRLLSGTHGPLQGGNRADTSNFVRIPGSINKVTIILSMKELRVPA